MIVGAAVVEIHIHGSRSLKQRRGVVRSIAQRLRNRFNLSVAEVGRDGGLVLAPTHVLEPEVPWANIDAFVEACREFGKIGASV